MELYSAVTALSALAQEHRLQAYRLLVQAGDAGLAAGTIAEAMAMPASSLSFHLAQMERAGLIRRQRRGRSLIYSADYGGMTALIAYLTENCCAGSPGACTPSPERNVA